MRSKSLFGSPCWIVAATLSVVLVAVACAPKSAADRVRELRSHYTAKLNGFVVKQQPPPMPEGMTTEGMTTEGMATEGMTMGGGHMAAPQGAAGTAGEATGATTESVGGMETTEGSGMTTGTMAMMPTTEDLVLDILVTNDGYDTLPGLTLDVSIADPQGREKEHRRIWVDTSQVQVGNPVQLTQTLEDVPYQPGDGVNVEVLQSIPPSELSEYREFQTAG